MWPVRSFFSPLYLLETKSLLSDFVLFVYLQRQFFSTATWSGSRTTPLKVRTSNIGHLNSTHAPVLSCWYKVIKGGLVMGEPRMTQPQGPPVYMQISRNTWRLIFSRATKWILWCVRSRFCLQADRELEETGKVARAVVQNNQNNFSITSLYEEQRQGYQPFGSITSNGERWKIKCSEAEKIAGKKVFTVSNFLREVKWAE